MRAPHVAALAPLVFAAFLSSGWALSVSTGDFCHCTASTAPTSLAAVTPKAPLEAPYHRPRVTWLTVSEHMSGMLTATLACNRDLVDRVVVVTSNNDTATRRLCREEGIECHITEALHLNGDPFNKGRALREAQELLHGDPAEQGSLVLLVDNDICLPPDLWEQLPQELESGALYTTVDRCLFLTPDHARRGAPVMQTKAKWFKTMGFFQLYTAHPGAPLYSATASRTAGGSDLAFADSFGTVKKLPLYVNHFGATNSDWAGSTRDTAAWASVTLPPHAPCPCCAPDTVLLANGTAIKTMR